MKTNLETRPPSPALPVELLVQVVETLVAQDHTQANVRRHARGDSSFDLQKTLHACSCVNRAWHAATVEALYRYPLLTSKNYDQFVQTICPSVNAHIKKTDLANLVKVLDLRQLVFAGTKSLVARLLSRVKENLEVLEAPQTSFAVNSLAALSKCRRLKILDMSYVTESIPIIDFFRVTSNMPALHRISFPRSAFLPPKDGQGSRAAAWPPGLQHATLPASVTRTIWEYGPREATNLDTLTLFGNLDYLTSFLHSLVNKVHRLQIYDGLDTARDPHSIDYTNYLYRTMCEGVVNKVRVLELHRLMSLKPLLDRLRISGGIAWEEGQAPLEMVEELIIGPCHVPGFFSPNPLNPELIERGVSPAKTFTECLRFYEAMFGKLHSLRRVVLYNVDGESEDWWKHLEPFELSRYLVECEQRRCHERADEGYRAHECGLWVFNYVAQSDDRRRQDWQGESDFERAMGEDAMPLSDLPAEFPSEVWQEWPHAAKCWTGSEEALRVASLWDLEDFLDV